MTAYLAPAARLDGSDTDKGPHDMRCSIFESCHETTSDVCLQVTVVRVHQMRRRASCRHFCRRWLAVLHVFQRLTYTTACQHSKIGTTLADMAGVQVAHLHDPGAVDTDDSPAATAPAVAAEAAQRAAAAVPLHVPQLTAPVPQFGVGFGLWVYVLCMSAVDLVQHDYIQPEQYPAHDALQRTPTLSAWASQWIKVDLRELWNNGQVVMGTG